MLNRDKIRILIRHPVFIPIYLPATLQAFGQGILVPILPLYAASFEISYGLIGLILAGDAIGLLMGDVPAGSLIRRFGAKRVVLLGLGLNIVTVAALFWAETVWVVLALRIASGVGKALYNVSLHAYITDHVFVAQRGRAIALFGGVHRFGWFVGPAVGGILAAAAGLRAPFILYGAAVTLGLVILAVLLRDRPAPDADNVQLAHPAGGQLWTTLKTYYRTLASAGMGQLFAQMIRTGRQSLIPLYAADILGLDAQAIGFIVSISSGIDMLLFYPAGWVMDNLGRKFAIVPSFIVLALGMALIPFTVTAGGLLFASSLMGFANGFSAGTMMTLGSDLAPQSARGEFLGMWRLIGDGGAMGAPVLVGGIADLLTLPTAALALAGAGVAAAGIFAVFVPETLEKRKAKVA